MHTLLLMWLSDFCDLLGFPTATVIWGALRNVHADKKYPVHQSVPRTSSLLVPSTNLNDATVFRLLVCNKTFMIFYLSLKFLTYEQMKIVPSILGPSVFSTDFTIF